MTTQSKREMKHSDFKKELLADPKVRSAYDSLEEEYQLIREMLKARQRAGKSQRAVAKAMHTTPSVVSRLESMHLRDHPSPSLATLKKYARAVGCRISLKIVPLAKKA